MPGCARKKLLLRDGVQVVHCYTRCVRREFLAGVDPLTGQDFSYRRDWIRSLLQEQAALFGIETGFHVQMSNHLHLVLRTRPDVVKRWSKEKVVQNWLKIAKLKRGSEITDWEPDEQRVRMEMSHPKRVKRLRRRLSNVSWYMATLCENVARRANQQDGVTGKFFEQRYKLQDLADESAILVCGMYVDLNQIYAGEAITPEDFRYTSAYDRIQGRKALAATDQNDPEPGIGQRDRWLCELTLDEGSDVDVSQDACSAATRWRASDKGLLPITLNDYLTLLDWTGRQFREDKKGSIPAKLAPILQRLQINADNWLETISEFDSRFTNVVGRVESMSKAAVRMGRCRLAGLMNAARAFD